MGLLRQAGTEHAPAATAGAAALAPAPHATTVVALRYADGVIMAGDRRATMGNIIAHRSMEKVFAADRYSAAEVALLTDQDAFHQRPAAIWRSLSTRIGATH